MNTIPKLAYNIYTMADYSALIATKFHIPPARLDMVARPRLSALLERGTNLPLTLVSAPPGFGKTMLVAAWLQNSPAAYCWLSLDEADGQPAVFWQYLIAAIQHARPAAGETSLAMLSSTQPIAIEIIITALINDLAGSPEPLILVLDDYHHIHLSAIHASLNFFLDHLPQNIHLLLISREDPPLALARRRARRQMVEIRAADLRFTPQETAAFLNTVMNLELTVEQVAALDQRTEGWIVGLQMAGLSLQGRDPQAFFDSFAGDDRYVADYLIEEVLQYQSQPVRDFLLKTSVLERISAPLCEALLEGSQPPITSPASELLAYLERANLFLVPLDNRREWYRYHHLFAELLQQRLNQAYGAGEQASLHEKASRWFETQGDIPTAIRHARLAPDPARAVTLLEQYAGWLFTGAGLPQLLDGANLVPPALRRQHPALCMAAAWAALTFSHFSESENWLGMVEDSFNLKAETALSDPELDPDKRAALLEVVVVRLQFPYDETQAAQKRQMIEAVRDQFDRLQPEQTSLFNTIAGLQPVIAFDLGQNAELQGEFELANHAFSEAVAFARQTQNGHIFHLALGHLANVQTIQGFLKAAFQTHTLSLAEGAILDKSISPYIAIAHAGLGGLLYEWNELASAEEHFRQAVEMGRLWNQWESVIPASLGLARLKRALGDRQAAAAILDTLAMSGKPPQGALLPIEAYRACLLAEAGERAAAANWLEDSGLLNASTQNMARDMVLVDAAHLLLLLDRAEEAKTLASGILNTARVAGWQRMAIQAGVILAKAYTLLGQSGQALEHLEEALRLAEAEGYMRTFLDGGETIHRLAAELRPRINPTSSLAGYMGRLLAVFDPLAAQPARPVLTGEMAEPLSSRELEVLRLVAAGLSNQAIAERLVISLTTVKTHIGNIYQKLGVASRTQAIARAEALGLLPPR